MNMRTLEREILNELKIVSGVHGIRQKDIQEWSTGSVKRMIDETVFTLPRLAVNVSVKTLALGKRYKAPVDGEEPANA